LPGNAAERARAFAPLREGLPHRRVEAWKYTDLRARLREMKPLAAPPGAELIAAVRARGLPLAKVPAARVVLLNGSFVPELSDLSPLPDAVEWAPLGAALAAGHPLLARLGTAGAPPDNAAVALAAAFAADGVLLRVPAGLQLDLPLHILHLDDGEDHAAFGRSLVVAEPGASLTLVESHGGGTGAHQTGRLLEILAEDGATVRHLKLQDEGLDSIHLSTLAVRLGAKARLDSLGIERGALLARQQIFVAFAGEDAGAAIGGAALAGGTRHLDTTLRIDHAVPGGATAARFHSALDGEARSVFQGCITVAAGAQHTDARMVARALLLSEGCEADLKPELEIYADDVQCGHGATASALDEEQLFYLEARGLPRPEAEAMLVEAFIAEVLEGAPDGLRAAADALAAGWLVARD
jgi:Fe-S cluster assembly protein SufD